ncbi:30S ribosomal protein S6 [Patescibacteria group bacterium]|nr:30S ribosomal protein S6 [Patescibacteria group bacterium]
MMQHYELLYIVPIKYLDDELTKVIEKISGVIKEQGGELTADQIFGRQKLAYPIKQAFQGTYVAVEFNMEGEQMKKLDSLLKLMPEIIRHLIVKKRIKTEAEIKRENKIQENLRQEKEDELKKLDEDAKPGAIKEEPETLAKAPEAPTEKVKAEKQKLSLEDLDKKLDDILTDDML